LSSALKQPPVCITGRESLSCNVWRRWQYSQNRRIFFLPWRNPQIRIYAARRFLAEKRAAEERNENPKGGKTKKSTLRLS